MKQSMQTTKKRQKYMFRFSLPITFLSVEWFLHFLFIVSPSSNTLIIFLVHYHFATPGTILFGHFRTIAVFSASVQYRRKLTNHFFLSLGLFITFTERLQCRLLHLSSLSSNCYSGNGSFNFRWCITIRHEFTHLTLKRNIISDMYLHW